jgi:hypothetical protein
MPTGLYFSLKYFFFTFTLHPAYNDARVQRHYLYGPTVYLCPITRIDIRMRRSAPFAIHCMDKIQSV